MGKNRSAVLPLGAIAFAFVISLVAWNLSANVQYGQGQNVPSGSSNPSVGLGVQSPVADRGSTRLTLYSVASVEKMLNRTLILPSTSAVTAIDPSLRLIGVALSGQQSPHQWQVSMYYSANQTFFNGTTTVRDLVGTKGIHVIEAYAPLGVNSSQVAHDSLAPGIIKLCTTISGSSPNSVSTVQCQTSAGGGGTDGEYIVVQNGLSIVVSPAGILSWSDGRQGVAVGIESENLSSSQLLNLASTMTA